MKWTRIGLPPVSSGFACRSALRCGEASLPARAEARREIELSMVSAELPELTILDLAKWVQRAIAFTEALRDFPGQPEIRVDLGTPTYTRDQEQAFSVDFPLQLPDVLVDWYMSVGSCNCTYLLEIPATFEREMTFVFPTKLSEILWGGLDLLDSKELAYCEMREFAASFQEAAFTRSAELWANSFPLIREGNGDHIGLYVGKIATEPSVVYLCYELFDGSRIISPSFEQFLCAWEELGYIGCHLLVDCFCSPATGLIDTKFREEAVRVLRGIFKGIHSDID